MNYVSLYIYLAQITDNLNSFGTFLFITSIISSLMVLFIALMYVTEHVQYGKRLDEYKKFILKPLKYAVLVMIFGGLLSTFVPTKETMVLIAASEIGEKIVTSDKIQSVETPALNLLNVWIASETKHIEDENKTNQ